LVEAFAVIKAGKWTVCEGFALSCSGNPIFEPDILSGDKNRENGTGTEQDKKFFKISSDSRTREFYSKVQ